MYFILKKSVQSLVDNNTIFALRALNTSYYHDKYNMWLVWFLSYYLNVYCSREYFKTYTIIRTTWMFVSKILAQRGSLPTEQKVPGYTMSLLFSRKLFNDMCGLGIHILCPCSVLCCLLHCSDQRSVFLNVHSKFPPPNRSLVFKSLLTLDIKGIRKFFNCTPNSTLQCKFPKYFVITLTSLVQNNAKFRFVNP